MKLPQRMLQFGALALFSSMIGGLVLYRGGILTPNTNTPSWFAKVKQDSLQPPWLDTVQLKQILQEINKEHQSYYNSRSWMYGSKSAPPAPPTRIKRGKAKKNTAESSDPVSIMPYESDTIVAMDILRTRYEVAHFSDKDAADFKQLYAAFQAEDNGFEEYYQSNLVTLSFGRDSTRALEKLKYSPQHLPQLSQQEMIRFESVLDSLTRPRMMSSKTGIIFISAFDTTQAIKIVKAEKRSQ